MSDFRRDALFQRWVVISAQRAARPFEFHKPRTAARRDDLPCPFCAGNETETPGEIVRFPAGNDWRVRVVPNLFPAVDDAATEEPAGDFHVVQRGTGSHEVIVESAEHRQCISELPDDQAALIFHAYRARIAEVGSDPRTRFVQLFKNKGPAAGASIEHVHSQLISLPFLPDAVERELRQFAEYQQQQGRCGLCEMVEREGASSSRVVAETARLLAFCPYASRLPHEVWIAPKRHESRFDQTDDQTLAELTTLCTRIASRFGRLFDDAQTTTVTIGKAPRVAMTCYNYSIHTAPFDTDPHDHYHWRMEMFPRLSIPAGFEFGSGCFINPTPPEDSAEFLRA